MVQPRCASEPTVITDHTLDAFSKTLNLPPASLADTEDYRTYLATHNPIAEVETRFLDSTADLVCLGPSNRSESGCSGSRSSVSETSDGLLTPVPHRLTFLSHHTRSSSSSSSRPPSSPKQGRLSAAHPPPTKQPDCNFPSSHPTTPTQPKEQDTLIHHSQQPVLYSLISSPFNLGIPLLLLLTLLVSLSIFFPLQITSSSSTAHMITSVLSVLLTGLAVLVTRRWLWVG